jgi:acetyl coenzyme A synthetase (ADP forming)-like protein
MHPVSPSLPAVDEIEVPRIVLRDGSVAHVRVSNTGDRAAIERFFESLSAESRQQRFFSTSPPPAWVLQRFCDSSDKSRACTLLVERHMPDGTRVIAVASYIATASTEAEVAFAVDDRFQGKGLGTELFERLAVLATRHGFVRFQATTLTHNRAMLEVFNGSGFQVRTEAAGGCLELELGLTASPAGVAASEERHRIAAAASLEPLLAPRAVAVVGASRNATGIGRRVFDALRLGGFRGGIHPVNPSAADIDGVRCVATCRDLPDGVDLAVIAVPRDQVPGVIDDCAAKGIKSLVVITAGYAETGEAGRALQDRLTQDVRGYGMRMVGPNCMGLLNASPDVRMNASFSTIFPAAGSIAMSSQSGALGLVVLELAAERNLGLSSFVSVGNKADVSGNDLLQYWETDPRTSVILLYLESFGNPRRFGRLARRISRTKPIVAVKAGRTPAGLRAASSHTAALAARDVAVGALFRQSGVIRAATIDEMFDVAACLDAQPLPSGRRVAIVTNAGGPGILAADACGAGGLSVIELSPATQTRLRSFLAPEANVGNPVDMIASAGADAYRRAVETVLAAEEVDALIVLYTSVLPRTSPDILTAIRDGVTAARALAPHKPVLASVMAEPAKERALTATSETIPIYRFPENAARALATVADYADWRRQPPGQLWGFEDVHPGEARRLCQAVLDRRGEDWLTPEEVQRVLFAFGLPLVPATEARTADEAVALAGVIGLPVAMKLMAPGLLHKSDAGAVKVGLADEDAVRDAFNALERLAARHVLGDRARQIVVQPMVGGLEMLIGVSDDPLFGPLVGFGLGGIHVELLGDVAFRVAPLTDRDADELLRETRGSALLQGYRGQPPADIAALRELLLRVSKLAEDVPELGELDLNPVMALRPGQGCRIVDARLKVGRTRRGSRT